MLKFTKRLAVVATIGMFLVLVQGALVTTTGSAEGCGQSWPLCHGEFIPSYALETMIEYTHRFVVGIETFLLIGTAIGALWFWRHRTEIRVYAPLMISFLFIQAGLGAAAVMWPQTPEILALHFGISLIAFSSVLLTAIFLYEVDTVDKLRDRPVPRHFTKAVFGLTVYTYLVVYLGAYVRHRDASMACTDWPLCNGQVWPGFSGVVGIVFGHRLSALVTVLAVGALIYWAYRVRDSRPDLFWGSTIAGVLVLAQAFSGAFVVWTQLSIFSTMSHGLFVSLFFGTLTYLCIHVLPRPESARLPSTTTEPQTAPSPQGSRVPTG